MAEPNIRQMFEAGAHFGHQTRFWNPDMAPYIYGERNKIHIIDLDTVLPLFKDALGYLESVGMSGGKVLFVGTKRAARESIERHARRCDMPYVNHRWLGGMLTNFKTVRQSVKRFVELEQEREESAGVRLSKKQALRRDREVEKMRRNFDGVRDMTRPPEAMFVIDVRHEKIAVREAKKLEIPTVAVVDTNNSLKGVDYVVPGNDDAIRAVELYVSAAADAILRGIERRESEAAEARSGEADKEIIKVASGSDAGRKAAASRKTVKAVGSRSDEETRAKPKIRMRSLKQVKEIPAGERDGERNNEKRDDDRPPGDEGQKTAAENAAE